MEQTIAQRDYYCVVDYDVPIFSVRVGRDNVKVKQNKSQNNIRVC